MISKITMNATMGFIARQWTDLYCQLSAAPLPATVRDVAQSFVPLLATLYSAQGLPKPDIENPATIPFRTALAGHTSKVLIAFTGGKDSTATALELRRQGFECTLFYVKGLNSQSFAGEQVYAARVAGVLDMPFVMLEVKQTGKPDYPDNPIKNQYILALMVEHGLRNGYINFAQGNLQRERIAETNINFTASDAAEMYDAAGVWFADVTRGTFQYLGGVMEFESQSYQTINEQCPEALETILSCTQAYRYRARVRRANEEKYGVELRPECCGTCYKCATEYLHRVLLGLAESRAAYVERCIRILQDAHKRLAGLEHLPTPAAAVDWFVEPSIFDKNGLGFQF